MANYSYSAYQNVLNNIKSLKCVYSAKRNPNIFEVAGFPHHENVMSNILKFFFDTNEEHGLNDLWLKSLLHVYKNKTNKQIPLTGINTYGIYREYSNGSDKRIDLLIDASPMIIVIENKISAPADYNPFDIYEKMAKYYIKDNNIDNPILIEIVLSLSKEKNISNTNFVNITYEELFEAHDAFAAEYSPVQKWQVFEKDFIDNLRRKKVETVMKLDKEWIDFSDNNYKQLNKLRELYESSVSERVSITKSIDQYFNDTKNVHGTYAYRTSSYCSHYIDFKMDDGSVICIETYLMKYPVKKEFEDFDKLYIALWCRTNKNYGFDYILDKLNKTSAKSPSSKGTITWGKHYILDEVLLTDEFDIEMIASTIKQYAEKINSLISTKRGE
jgi:hypothetical protein